MSDSTTTLYSLTWLRTLLCRHILEPVKAPGDTFPALLAKLPASTGPAQRLEPDARIWPEPKTGFILFFKGCDILKEPGLIFMPWYVRHTVSLMDMQTTETRGSHACGSEHFGVSSATRE